MEEVPPVLSAHFVRWVGPCHLPLTSHDWLIGFGLRFLGGIGPRCLSVSGHRFLTGEVVTVGRDGKLSPLGPRAGCREWGGLICRPLWPDLPPSSS